MNWKISLDRYLTTPPDNGFDDWSESVLERISDSFYSENESWVNDYDGQFNKWLNELFERGKSSIDAAMIIERAFGLYLKKRQDNK